MIRWRPGLRGGLLLDRPAVAVGVAEERKRVPRPAVTVLPLAALDEADGRDVDAGVGELRPGGVDVGDAQLQALERARVHLRQPLPDRDRTGRSRRRQLDDAELVADRVVDVDVEAEV